MPSQMNESARNRENRVVFLRPDELLRKIDDFPVAYWPVGPLEWHGPHLPVGTDPLNAERAALITAEKTGGLVFPTFYWGTERERDPKTLEWLGFDPELWMIGMDFPANTVQSHYAREEVFGVLVREQLRMINRMGFKLVVIISGHGATNHLDVLKRLAAEFSAAGPAKFRVVVPFAVGADGVMRVGHASRIETAMMMAHYPETVDLTPFPEKPEKIRNQDWAVIDYATFTGDPMPDHTIRPDDDPRDATAEEGLMTIETVVAQMVEMVHRELG